MTALAPAAKAPFAIGAPNCLWTAMGIDDEELSRKLLVAVVGSRSRPYFLCRVSVAVAAWPTTSPQKRETIDVPLRGELPTFPRTVFTIWNHVIDTLVTGVTSIATNFAAPTLDAGFSDLFVIPFRRRCCATTHGESPWLGGRGEGNEGKETNGTNEERPFTDRA